MIFCNLCDINFKMVCNIFTNIQLVKGELNEEE